MFHKNINEDLQIHLQLLANNIVKSNELYLHNYNKFSFQNHSNPLGLTNTHCQTKKTRKNLMNNTQIHIFYIFFYVDLIFSPRRCRRSFQFTSVDCQIGLLFGLVFAIANFTGCSLYLKKKL